jgi:phenylalanyl-tRNA synthetase alpha chain
MRKRLQRIRDKLRKEMEMSEQRDISNEDIQRDLPAKVVELLARPRLTDLPENPVGKTLETVRSVFPEFVEQPLPEFVDLEEARKTIGNDALYIDPIELHRLADGRILRYDLTLPLLLTVRYEGKPLRLWSAGKVYRAGKIDAMHLDAFHQAEALWLDSRASFDPWQMTGRVFESVNRLFPGRSIKVVPTHYQMCTQAWEIEVEDEGRWFEVLAWGVFTDRIVRHLGAGPERHTVVSVGYGLERLAMLRYGIDDIRRVEIASVA